MAFADTLTILACNPCQNAQVWYKGKLLARSTCGHCDACLKLVVNEARKNPTGSISGLPGIPGLPVNPIKGSP